MLTGVLPAHRPMQLATRGHGALVERAGKWGRQSSRSRRGRARERGGRSGCVEASCRGRRRCRGRRLGREASLGRRASRDDGVVVPLVEVGACWRASYSTRSLLRIAQVEAVQHSTLAVGGGAGENPAPRTASPQISARRCRGRADRSSSPAAPKDSRRLRPRHPIGMGVAARSQRVVRAPAEAATIRAHLAGVVHRPGDVTRGARTGHGDLVECANSRAGLQKRSQ